MMVVSGSCVDFEEERSRIVELLDMLVMATRTKEGVECSSMGKNTLAGTFSTSTFRQDSLKRYSPSILISTNRKPTA